MLANLGTQPYNEGNVGFMLLQWLLPRNLGNWNLMRVLRILYHSFLVPTHRTTVPRIPCRERMTVKLAKIIPAHFKHWYSYSQVAFQLLASAFYCSLLKSTSNLPVPCPQLRAAQFEKLWLHFITLAANPFCEFPSSLLSSWVGAKPFPTFIAKIPCSYTGGPKNIVSYHFAWPLSTQTSKGDGPHSSESRKEILFFRMLFHVKILCE